jgi:hypothetical protein
VAPQKLTGATKVILTDPVTVITTQTTRCLPAVPWGRVRSTWRS